MFVRWKKRQLSAESGKPDEINTSLYAVLVENNRIEGKTRQKVVKYLGYINESAVNEKIHQERFWQQVKSNLDPMGLDQSEYSKIISKLADVVPNPIALASYASIPCIIKAGYIYLAT